MPNAAFSHKPHVLQAQCETCHSAIATSRAGVDANVPSVSNCQSCHKSSQARTDCVECHTYHPRSAAELTLAQWR